MITYSKPGPGIITLPLLDQATCERLITLADEHDWEQAGVMKRTSNAEVAVMTEVRSATISYVERDTDAWRVLHEKMTQVVRPLVRTEWKRDFREYSDFQVVRYLPGDFYHTHRDSGPNNPNRYFTVVCYLNDGFEGGGTHFPEADYTVEPIRGHALIFPSAYLHQAQRVVGGTKYIAVAWLLGTPPIQWM
ncbi:MAG: prolyl hydroxylase family protein [Rhodothermales bacterium]